MNNLFENLQRLGVRARGEILSADTGLAEEVLLRIAGAESTAPRWPIVAVTASATGDVRSKCLASGMDDVITKPMDAALLREVLERWLRKGA